MPSSEFSELINRSLAPGERYNDFAYMFDFLLSLRQSLQLDEKFAEEIVGRILCVIMPDKPERYTRAMRGFRMRFANIAKNPELQADFANSIRPAVLSLRDPTKIVWSPSTYFRFPDEIRTVHLEWY